MMKSTDFAGYAIAKDIVSTTSAMKLVHLFAVRKDTRGQGRINLPNNGYVFVSIQTSTHDRCVTNPSLHLVGQAACRSEGGEIAMTIKSNRSDRSKVVYRLPQPTGTRFPVSQPSGSEGVRD